jgi:hypothetical protein
VYDHSMIWKSLMVLAETIRCSSNTKLLSNSIHQLLIWGGYWNGSLSNDLLVQLDPSDTGKHLPFVPHLSSSEPWTIWELDNKPPPRAGHRAVDLKLDEDEMLVFGGYGDDYTFFGELWLFNFATDPNRKRPS